MRINTELEDGFLILNSSIRCVITVQNDQRVIPVETEAAKWHDHYHIL